MTDSPADFPPPRTWPAILWALASAAVLLVAQVVGTLAAIGWEKYAHPAQPFSLKGLATDGAAIAIITFISSLILLLTFIGFARIRTRAVRLYLGLRLPRLRDLILGIVALALLLAALGLASSKFEDPRAINFMRDLFLSAKRDHLLWLLLATVSIAAPVGEEVMFRGFLYKTIELRFGAIAAILVTALGWAALHIQYGLISIASIFAIGLFLGTARYYSRSLILTMILHGIWNGMALLGSSMMFNR
jgi:hypothetical protein